LWEATEEVSVWAGLYSKQSEPGTLSNGLGIPVPLRVSCGGLTCGDLTCAATQVEAMLGQGKYSTVYRARRVDTGTDLHCPVS